MNRQIEIGDTVRSFDFPEITRHLSGREACYFEGVITGFTELEGCTRYVLRVESRVWQGEEMNGVPEVYPPVNGTPTIFRDSTNGVELLNKGVES